MKKTNFSWTLIGLASSVSGFSQSLYLPKQSQAFTDWRSSNNRLTLHAKTKENFFCDSKPETPVGGEVDEAAFPLLQNGGKSETKLEKEIVPQMEKTETIVGKKTDLDEKLGPQGEIESEPEAQLEKTLEPEEKIEPQVEKESEPEAQLEKTLEPEEEFEPQVEKESEPEAQLEKTLEPEEEFEPQVEKESEPEAQLEKTPEPEEKLKPQVEKESEPEALQEKKTELEVKSEPKQEIESKPETQLRMVLSQENIDFAQSVLGFTAKASLEALKALRFVAANALTSTLPDDQRKDLLERMGQKPIVAKEAKEIAVDAVDVVDVVVERGSVQEEISVAVAEERRRDKEKWKVEKEQIEKQMEDAVKERVQNELAIQKQRLEKEKKMMIDEVETERAQLELEKNSLHSKVTAAIEEETRLNQERWSEEKKEIAKQMEDAVNDRVKQELAEQKQRLEEEKEKMIEEVENRRKELEKEKKKLRQQLDRHVPGENTDDLNTTLSKRKQQQEELEIVEANLRKRVQEIEEEKAKISKLQKEVEEAKERISDEPLKDQKNASEETVEASNSNDEEVEDVNPVLGPVIYDLGYKRIHVVSSGKLGTVPVWNKNRIYQHARARSMAVDKVKTMHLGFPGSICLHEDNNGKLSIIDGQHRVGMMSTLREKRNKQKKANNEEFPDDYIFDNILVEVYPQSRQSEDNKTEHPEKIFSEINKAEPVKLVDMPGVASAADRKIIMEAVTNLQYQFPAMFSPSQKCRVPNVNIDNMRNNIYGSNIMKRYSLTTGKMLTDWLLVQNANLGEKYERNNDAKSFFSGKAWKKASTNGFYLGLESSWLYK